MSALDHQVVIAGGGPTGMMLAAELTLAGVDVAIVEPRDTWVGLGQRSGGLHARTIEVLDQRGIADRFLSAGFTAQVVRFADVTAELDDFPTRHPYGLALWQPEFERILGDWVDELGVTVDRGSAITRLGQDDHGIDVELSDGRTLRAGYLVGCDGGRSAVRRAADIDFPGCDPTKSFLIGEIEFDEVPPFGMQQDAAGTHGLAPMEGGSVRVMVTERALATSREPTLEDLRAELVSVFGKDHGLRRAILLSRFTDAARQAATYRRGRVLLAGDAAHVHPPHGGQGLNTGIQDAVNLGWKLAQVVKGNSPDTLLDTYEAERHPVGARAMRHAMAQAALSGPDPQHAALRETVAEMMAMDEPRHHVAALVSGLDIAYDLGGEHPMVGRRMPDLDVTTSDGAQTIYSMLHLARPVLLHFGEAEGRDLSAWADRVDTIRVQFAGTVMLPVLGEVPTPPAALIRPDGYVAWAGDPTDPGLLDALTMWFGAPT